VHPWPTFVLIVLVSGFLIAIGEIIVDEIRGTPGPSSRRNRARSRPLPPQRQP
jgi:hypothetical protein